MTYKKRIEALAVYSARIRAQFAPESGFVRRLSARMRRVQRSSRASERRLGIFRPFDAIGFAVMWGYRLVFAPGDVKILYGFSFSKFFVGFLFKELTDITPPAAQE
jgi:hypothetical protein